jgi:hypothetical protein
MSQELIYTSVPRGLKPGTKGFCTVVITADMPAALVERLESLSGYRPIFPLGDPSAGSNPVNWAHWRITVGGKPRSVLSRVAFAGVDYSQRSNKFAHHLVLEPEEQSPAGPAWIMLQPDVMQSVWPHEPQILSSGRVVPDSERPLRLCTAWAAATGDAGWAGVLAENYRSHSDKPLYVLYGPGTEVLPLIDESLSLLPPSLRWQVTFSTYFTELPIGLSCTWRFTVAGSQAAKDAGRMGATVVDLTRPLGSPSTGPLVDAARSGHLAPASGLGQIASDPRREPFDNTPDSGGRDDRGNLAASRAERGRRRLGAEVLTTVEDLTWPTEMGGEGPSPSLHFTRAGLPIPAVALVALGCLMCGVLLGYGLALSQNRHSVAMTENVSPKPSELLPPIAAATRQVATQATTSPVVAVPASTEEYSVSNRNPADAQLTERSTTQGAGNPDRPAKAQRRQVPQITGGSPQPENHLQRAAPESQPITVAPISVSMFVKKLELGTMAAATKDFFQPKGKEKLNPSRLTQLSVVFPNKEIACAGLRSATDHSPLALDIRSHSTKDEQTLATISIASNGNLVFDWRTLDRDEVRPILLASEFILKGSDGTTFCLRLDPDHIEISRDELANGYRLVTPLPGIVREFVTLKPAFSDWSPEGPPLKKGKRITINYGAPWNNLRLSETLDFGPQVKLTCAIPEAILSLTQDRHYVEALLKRVDNLDHVGDDDGDVRLLRTYRPGLVDGQNGSSHGINFYNNAWTSHNDAKGKVKSASEAERNGFQKDADSKLKELHQFRNELVVPLRAEVRALNDMESELNNCSLPLVFQNGVTFCEVHCVFQTK